MATASATSEHDLFQNLVFPFDKNLEPEAARALLRICFDRPCLTLINRLLRKNQRGVITAEERILLEKFLRLGTFIDILHAKARKALIAVGKPM